MPDVSDSVLSISQLETPITNRAAGSQRSWPYLIFVVLSMLVQISLGQEDKVEVNSPTYWMLVAPALIFPIFNYRKILNGLIAPQARLLLLFGMCAAAWHFSHGDMRAVSQLMLLVWVTAWVRGSRTPFLISDLVKLYVGLVLIGILIDVFTRMNVWGLLPGTTREDYGIWRVSFFPNIANTGMLSLFMILLLTRDRITMVRHPVALAISLYFLIFSFVRTAQIAVVLYLLMRLWCGVGRHPNKQGQYFWGAIIITITAHAFIAFSPFILDFAQNLPLVSRLFLRGEEGLTTQEIFEQAYRPWLWGQHLNIFASSPGLMGLGAFNFDDVIDQGLIFEHVDMGSESLPTRLLAAYGLPAFFFIGFIIGSLRRRAYLGDHWACACFPAVFLIMMNWGSVFHPTNAFFVLFFFILLHGSEGFSEKYPPRSH